MKQTKRLFCLLLVLVMLVTTAVPAMAMAVDPGSGSTSGEGITSVKVSNITTPIAGAKPNFDITLTGTGVTFDAEGPAVVWWYDDPLTGSEYDLDETSIFAPGCYWMTIYLKAEEGYQFTEDTKFYFDKEVLPHGDDIEDYYVSSYWFGDDYAVICLCFVVKPEDPCTVTFAANGGKGTMAPVTNAEGFYTLPECGFTAPAGKAFRCWSINGVYTIPGEQILVTEDTIVIAIWEKSVTISFDAGGGSGTMAPVIIPSGSFIELPECGFTAPGGKQFLYWSIEGYDRMFPGEWLDEEITEDITVTAVWGTFLTSVNITGIIAPVAGEKADPTGVTSNTENVTIGFVQWLRGSMGMNGRIFETGKTYTLSIDLNVAEGYGIADDVVITHDLPGAVASYDRTYQCVELEYTIPAAAPCTISFAANGGTGTMASVTRSLGSYYTLPECDFTAPAGKQFKCWSVDGEERTPGYAITVTADTTVTAVWEKIPTPIHSISITGITAPVAGEKAKTAAITVNTEGLSTGVVHWVKGSSIMNSQTFEAGVTYELLIYLDVAEGYQIADDVAITHDLPGAGVSFNHTHQRVDLEYTVPEPTASYTVSFAANGGSGTMAAVTGVSGSYTLPECGFTAPTGKQFKCWSVDGSEKAPGDTVTVTADTTVTALWTQTTIRPFIYTVSFDPGTGTGTMAPQITDGPYTLPKCTFTAPLRSLFLGWVVNNSLYNPGDIITVTKDITVTALWAKSSLTGYIVTYNGNGGTGTMMPQRNVSGAFTLPNCGYTAPAGQEFQAYLINGTEYQPGDVITVSAPTIISVLWKAASQGVAVSGTVTSFHDEAGEITLHLISQGMTEPAYEAIVKGNTASYSFDNVLAGTYTLRISKKNHVTREYTVVVGSGSVTQDVKIHLVGDVTGDGRINVGDTGRVFAHVKGSALITDDYLLDCADVTGDGRINIGDTSRIFAHVKGTGLLW